MTWEQSDSGGGGKKYLDTDCVVKKVQTEFADILDTGYERKKSKMSPRVLAWQMKEWSYHQLI